MDKNKDKLRQIQKKRLKNRVLKIDEGLNKWLRDLYGKIAM